MKGEDIMQGVKLAELTYPEAQKWLNEEAIVMLPLGGGSKEHGRHLPMGTDMYLCQCLADEVTRRFPVVTLPTLTYEHFPAFIDWEGSIHIQADHYIKLVKDILVSFVRHGVRKFLLLDFSFSAYFPLVTVATEMNNQYGAKVAITRTGGLGVRAKKRLMESKQDGHAGEYETSMMLYAQPQLVHTDRYDEEYREDIPGVRVGGVQHIYVSNRMETPHGVNGNPFVATADKYRELVEDTVNDIIRFLETFQKTPIDQY